MKRHHKILIAVALVLTVAAWLAWNMLLVGSDIATGQLKEFDMRGVARTLIGLLVGLLVVAVACGRSSESRQVADRFTDLYYAHARLADALELTTGAAQTRLQGELAAIKGVPPDPAADRPRVTLSLVSETTASPTQSTYVYNVDPQTTGVGPLVATVGVANQDGKWRVVTLDEKERK